MPLLLYMSGQSQGKWGLAYIRFRLSAQEQEIVTWICRQSFPTQDLCMLRVCLVIIISPTSLLNMKTPILISSS